jgi:hypothetical protein
MTVISDFDLTHNYSDMILYFKINSTPKKTFLGLKHVNH